MQSVKPETYSNHPLKKPKRELVVIDLDDESGQEDGNEEVHTNRNHSDQHLGSPGPRNRDLAEHNKEGQEHSNNVDEISHMKREAQERQKPTSARDHSLSPHKTPNGNLSDRVRQADLPRSPPPPPEPDPVVNIFINTRIPNTEPLIANLRLSQRLRILRQHWCGRQKAHNYDDFLPKVFFTWRNRRLFDVTTCKSLGVTADPETGEAVYKGLNGKPTPEDAQLVFEATTEQVFNEDRKRKEQDEKTERHGPELEVSREKEQPKPAEKGIRIVLKAKGYEEYKLLVKPVSSSPLMLMTPCTISC